MKKWIAMAMIFAMVLTLTACGGGEETTVSGMVMGVDGTVISLIQMDGQMEGGFGGGRFPGGENGEMPTRPEGMEDFNPEDMEDFTRPEGMEDFNPEKMEGFDPEKMEDFNFEDFDPEDMPEGFGPGGFGEGEPPEKPAEGERPEMGEATTIDIANAHISVEIEGGKESGSMENIVPGAVVTVTLSPKGEATYVLVSQSMGFGGFGNFPAMT